MFQRARLELDVLNCFLLITVPGKPEVSVEQPGEAVFVSWTLLEKNGVMKGFHVTSMREDDPSDIQSRTTQENELQFDNLIAGKTYEFQVGITQ